MQRPTALPTGQRSISEQTDSLEAHPLFTPDLDYFTPCMIFAEEQSSTYHPRTLTWRTRERHRILPVFPPSTTFQGNSSIAVADIDELDPPLLLCNVSRMFLVRRSPNDVPLLAQALSLLQVQRRAEDAYAPCFQLIEHHYPMVNNPNDSFLVSIHLEMLTDLSNSWKISIPLLDFNLARLRHCAQQCLEQWQLQQRQEQLQWIALVPTTSTFAIEELPIALEFYLQMDGQ